MIGHDLQLLLITTFSEMYFYSTVVSDHHFLSDIYLDLRDWHVTFVRQVFLMFFSLYLIIIFCYISASTL